MTMDKKKFAAAIAAVTHYIKTTEEAAGCAAAPAEPDAQALPPAPMPFNTWGMTGRQAQMQANAMMLMRAFK